MLAVTSGSDAALPWLKSVSDLIADSALYVNRCFAFAWPYRMSRYGHYVGRAAGDPGQAMIAIYAVVPHGEIPFYEELLVVGVEHGSIRIWAR